MIDETVAEIEDMQTHSSSVVAMKAARALLELADREYPTVEEYVQALEQNSHALRRANPSHASLQTTQREIVSHVVDADPRDVSAAKAATADVVETVVERVDAAKRRAGERAAARLSDGDTVFTFDYSSTVLSALERAVDDGAALTVYCSEARPRMLGRKMARTLSGLDGVEVHLTVDGASGHFLPDCDRVLVGMDCIVDDLLYNRLGTCPLAVTADHFDVTFEAVGAASKVVGGGFAFENEYRPASEVILEPVEEFVVENPAYDATPVDLVDSVVTDAGIEEF